MVNPTGVVIIRCDLHLSVDGEKNQGSSERKFMESMHRRHAKPKSQASLSDEESR